MGTKKRFPGLFYRKDQMHSQDAAKLNDAIKANEGYTKKISYLAKVDDPEVYPQVKNLHERVHGDGVGESTWFERTVKESAPVFYTITFSCTNGAVAATVDGMGIQSDTQVLEGKTVIFTITPNEGYEYTGTNPESVVVSGTVTKNYVCTEIPVYHTVNFSCTYGSVGATVDGTGIQSGASVLEGKSVVFTITPDEGYQYTGTNPETVVVNADITKSYVCTAVVQPLKFVSSGTNTVYYSSQSMKNFSYSLDGGTTWNSLPNSSGSAVSFGTSGIFIKGTTSQPGYQCTIKFEGSDNVTISGDITCLINGTGGLTDISTYANAFRDIFKFNTKLVDASGLVLPTILSSSCFNQTFQGCTALTAAPALPATTLAEGCYYGMFYGCIALTSAPSLPATTLVQNCYREMFYECITLNEVHCSATNISASNCTTDWLAEVNTSGDFYGKTAAGWEPSSGSGIPANWTAHLD